MIRAVEVVSDGITTEAEPVFGAPARSTVGKVFPPSVERRMLTEWQLTGAALVPATSQVTVWVLPEAHCTRVDGEVTLNGPDDATLKLIAALDTPTPPAWLSRTVHLKESARA